jgi:hypothetical protein
LGSILHPKSLYKFKKEINISNATVISKPFQKRPEKAT